jgi:hypothetical protein
MRLYRTDAVVTICLPFRHIKDQGVYIEDVDKASCIPTPSAPSDQINYPSEWNEGLFWRNRIRSEEFDQ